MVPAAEPLEVLEGAVVTVATTPHLLALKFFSKDPVKRPQDLAGARMLLETASESEPAEVRRHAA